MGQDPGPALGQPRSIPVLLLSPTGQERLFSKPQPKFLLPRPNRTGSRDIPWLGANLERCFLPCLRSPG